MANVRVIRLDNINGKQEISVSSYEDAFEGFSNANGDKRRSKKIKRIQGRQEIDELRHESKDARQQNKISRKSGRKKGRQAIRQDKKNLAQEGRQGRLEYRKKSAVDRRGYGRDEEEMVDETMTPQYNAPEQADDYSQQDDSKGVDYSQQDNGGGYDNQSQSEPQYDESPSRNTDNYREEQLQDAGNEEEESDTDDGQYEQQFNEEYGSLTGIDESNVIVEVQKVPKPVLNAVKSIQDHKNRIAILMIEKEKGKTQLPELFCKFDGEGDDIDTMINTSRARVIDLEGRVESYQNANGVQAKRNVAIARKYCQRTKTKPTLVNPTLNPSISKQRIVVPAQKSSFDAVDTDDRVHRNYEIDIDGTQGRLFDIYSNADGTSGNMDIIKPIVIGAIVSIGAIYLVNYFKLIK